MIVTRNERYTDWLFQGVHMHEVAATVGNGLLSGHIYFRYATDFLKEGEKVLRSRSFIVLSDGSTYELGAGAVASKVTVIDHGLNASGEVHLEVRGIDGSGIGVHSITRDVTIEYDDGKVPVLDEDQLKGIMSGLHDSLEESMVETAEAVKTELREELQTIAIDVKQECAQTAEATKTELNSKIDLKATELNAAIGAVSTEVTTVSAKVDTVKSELVSSVSDKVRIGRWTFGQYTIGSAGFNNVLFATPTTMRGSDVFTHSGTNKSLVLNDPVTNVDRILRVSAVTTIEIPNGYAGHLVMHIRNIAGGTQCQDMLFLNRDHGLPQHNQFVFFDAEIFIPADISNHPIYGDGLRVEFIHSKSGANVILKSGTISFTLTTL